MCGRYTLIEWEELQARFHVWAEEPLQPRYNIAPTQKAAVITGTENRVELFRWGLIPYWAKEKTNGARLINARAETLEVKNSFRRSFASRRCLVPADGFYEWETRGAKKIPYRFTLREGGLFAFAGLWDVWVSPAGEEVNSFAIITTQANDLVSGIHDRMPVILSREAEEAWLDAGLTDPSVLKQLLLPYPAGLMAKQPVSTLVNSPKNETPNVLVPGRA